MTDWNDQIQPFGTGFVAYRLMVEGWPHEWVTDPRITHVVGLGLRRVYPGLSYEGLRIDERMVLRDAWPECSGITARIVPTDANEDTLNSFTRDPRVIATLTQPIVASDTTWTTSPTLGTGPVHLGTETIFVASDGETITRAYWDTEAQDHATIEGGKPNPVSIYNWPPTMEGRRAYLYAYGPNDDPDSDGQNIWRGVVKRPPAMDSDGVSWSIEIGPITDQFDQNLGASDELEYRIRGVYHSSSCPMTIGMTTDYNTTTPTMPIVRVYGFYENQDQFAAAVTTAFRAALGDATGNAASLDATKFVCNYTRIPGVYSMYFETNDGGHDDWPLIMRVMDALDGSAWVGSPGDAQLNGQPIYSGQALYWGGDANGRWFFEGLQRSAPYGYPLPAARTLVQGPIYTGEDRWPVVERILGGYKQDDDTYPDNRVYMQSVDGLEVGDVLCVKNGDASRLMQITAVDQDSRYIEVELLGSGDNGLYISSESTIVPIRVYGEDGGWKDFINSILTQAPAANLGKTPWLTAQDVDTSTWNGIWNSYPFHDYWRHRSYRFGKQIRIRDVFAAELQATGWMARMTLDGRLSVAPMPFISAQRSATWTITDDDILLPADEFVGTWPSWVAQSDGLVNIAKLRLEYDPITDEHIPSGDYTVRVTQSIAEHKSGDRASTEILVRSQSAAYPQPLNLFGFTFQVPQLAKITAENVVDMIMPYLIATSTDYATVTVAVPFTHFEVLVGDIVSVTSAYLPDGIGGRGVQNKKAIVVGRAWNLDPAIDEMGTLTLWFARDSGRVSGYAPTGRIGEKTDLGSNAWSLNFNDASSRNVAWAESDNGRVLEHFAAGDTVQLVEVDSLTPTVAYGTIVSIDDATHCTVQLEDTWTPGSATWNMRFYYDNDESVTLFAQERQAAYCWIADADREYLNGDYANFPTAREAL